MRCMAASLAACMAVALLSCRCVAALRVGPTLQALVAPFTAALGTEVPDNQKHHCHPSQVRHSSVWSMSIGPCPLLACTPHCIDRSLPQAHAAGHFGFYCCAVTCYIAPTAAELARTLHDAGH